MKTLFKYNPKQSLKQNLYRSDKLLKELDKKFYNDTLKRFEKNLKQALKNNPKCKAIKIPYMWGYHVIDELSTIIPVKGYKKYIKKNYRVLYSDLKHEYWIMLHINVELFREVLREERGNYL